jgi:ribonuclease BN (tRNA processing enzyme)
VIVTVVGSGTLVPSPRRSTPALCFQEGSFQATMDGGSGTLRRQAELGIDYRRTRVLFFTHIHPDHTLDLLHFLFAWKYGPGAGVGEPPVLVGPPGFARFVEHLRDGVRPWTDGGPGGFDVVELADGESRRFGPLDVRAVELAHPVVNHGYCVRAPGGASLAFTGDTGWCEALSDLARGVDVLIAECSGSADHPAPTHLTAPEVGRLAAATGVKQVVLSHLYPLTDDRVRLPEVARHYSGPVLLAEDGLRFVI